MSNSREKKATGHRPLRPRGTGGLFQTTVRGKLKWRATVRVQLPEPLPNGRKFKLFQATGDTKAQAALRLEQLKTDFYKLSDADQMLVAADGRRRERTTLTVSDFYYDQWLSSRRVRRWKPGTRRNNRAKMEKWFLPHLGLKKMMAVKTADLIKLFTGTLPTEGYTGGALRNLYTTSHGMFADAVRGGFISVSPFTGYPPEDVPPKPSVKTLDITPRYIHQLRQIAAKSDLSPAWLLQILTGMRPAEILGLTWDCVNFEKRTITVRQQLQSYVVEHGEGCRRIEGKIFECGKTPYNCPRHKVKPPRGLFIALWTKNEEERTFQVPYSIIHLLKLHRTEQRLQKTLDEWKPLARPKMDELIFTTDSGKPIRQQDFDKEWKKLQVEAGLTPLPPRNNRDVAITAMTLSGVRPEMIRKIVGHKDAEITERIYTHLTAEMEGVALKQVESSYREIAEQEHSLLEDFTKFAERATHDTTYRRPDGNLDPDALARGFTASRLLKESKELSLDAREILFAFLKKPLSNDMWRTCEIVLEDDWLLDLTVVAAAHAFTNEERH